MSEPAAEPSAPAAPAPAAPARDMEAELRTALATLDTERKARIKHEADLAKLRQTSMTETEKAMEKARGEGRAEAVKAAGARLAAAEFRARAAGRLPDPSALIEAIDLSRFVGDDGEPNVKAIDAMIEKLAAALPANGKPMAPTIPSGPRPDPTDADWLRQAIQGQGR